MKRSYKKTGGHQSHLPKSQVGHTTLMNDVRAGPEDYSNRPNDAWSLPANLLRLPWPKHSERLRWII